VQYYLLDFSYLLL